MAAVMGEIAKKRGQMLSSAPVVAWMVVYFLEICRKQSFKCLNKQGFVPEAVLYLIQQALAECSIALVKIDATHRTCHPTAAHLSPILAVVDAHAA